MAKKYLDVNGLSYFWGKLQNYFLSTDSNGNLSIPGSITVKDHVTAIGNSNNNNGSKSIASGNSPVTLSAIIQLTGGVYVLVGEASFAANATGARHLEWAISSPSQSGTRLMTRITRSATTGGFPTRIQTTDVVVVPDGELAEMQMNCYQNSGSALTVDYYWGYVRIA